MTEEEEEKFTVTAPKCGRTTFQAYQLLRLYTFSYKDKRSALRRFFSPLKKAPEGFEEWLNQVYDISATDEVDPDCLVMHPECGRKPVPPPDGLVNLIFERFGLLTSYRVGEEGIILTNVNATVPTKNIDDLLHSDVTFDRNMIPPYLLFLSGEGAETLTARVRPYAGELAKAKQVSRAGATRRKSSSHQGAPAMLQPLAVGGTIGAAVAFLLMTEYGRELLQGVARAVDDALGSSTAEPTPRADTITVGERSMAYGSQDAEENYASERPAAGAGSSGGW